jgi:hypothetical protein
MSDNDNSHVKVDIPVSLDEAETIAYVLADADEDHLAEHVKYCIQQAKQKSGYLQPARNTGQEQSS